MATPIVMPRQGQSVESCILVRWRVKPGDLVTRGKTVADIETDKATFEVECPEDGTILDLFFGEGDDIPVLTNIAAVGQPGEDVSVLRPGGAPAPAAAAPAAQVSSPGNGAGPDVPTSGNATPSPGGISPRARHRAERIGVDTAGLAGTGPGGRVIERDVIAAAGQGRMSPAAAAAAMAGGLAAPAVGTGPGGMVLAADLRAAASAPAPAAAPAGGRETEVSGIRRIVADRMRQSLAATAQYTISASFDATAIQSFRRRVKEQGEAMGLPAITINDLILFAVSRVLKRHPALNAHFLGDRIVEYGEVSLGIAMDTPRGLMVPVLAGADRMSLAAIARAVKGMGADAQAGSISPDLLRGGTFTVTNLGALGVEHFTPVINAPEVAILGVGGLVVKPVRRGGEVVFVDAIALSLTADHQAVDGAPAARFLQDLVRALEHIELTLAG